MKTVVVLRGVPGSGKSTYIKTNYPLASVCSADDFFLDKNGKYVWDPKKIDSAHSTCLRKFLHNLQSGLETVVVDNTNVRLWEIAPYVALAKAYGYEAKIIRINIPAKTAANRNVHGVPLATVNKMIKGFERALPWWNEEVIEAAGVVG